MTREQLLHCLRTSGGYGHAGMGAPSEDAADDARAAALTTPTPTPSGEPPAERRPAGDRQQPLPTAPARQQLDRAALLRWLRGSGT